MGGLITPMALVHPLHPIRSRSRNKHRNLSVGWCVSSWRVVYSIYYIHTIYYSCTRSNYNMLFLRDMFVVVNFEALAQASDFRIKRRQVVSLCWMQESKPEGLGNPIFSRLNACWQTDWAIEDQAKNLNSTARPCDQQAFSPPDPTAIWHSHLALAIYIFVFVNFDALAQASDFLIERRQVHIWYCYYFLFDFKCTFRM